MVEELVPSAPADSGTVSRVSFNYVIIAVTFLLLGAVLGAIGHDRLTQGNAAAIEQSVGRAIRANQAVFQDMIDTSLAAALEGAAGGAQRAGVDPNERYDIPVENEWALGPEDAPVTIVEFSDFRCGFCGRFARETLQPLMTAYEGQVRFVYRDFIIFGQPSYEAALAASCAGDQGKFWQFHDTIFANQQGLSRDFYLAQAGELELDVEQFTTCYDTEEHREAITTDAAFAQSLGLTGTPTFFVNGRVVNGAQPFEAFASIIDAELEAAAG